jgi:hypothetical protein
MIRVEIGIRIGVAFGIFLCRVSGIPGVSSFLIGFILLASNRYCLHPEPLGA